MQKNIKNKVFIAVSSLITTMVGGMFLFRWLEGWSFIESLYFTVVTMSTVGYGDLAPTNDFSRIAVIFFIFIGVSTAIASLGILGQFYLEKQKKKFNKIMKIKNKK